MTLEDKSRLPDCSGFLSAVLCLAIAMPMGMAPETIAKYKTQLDGCIYHCMSNLANTKRN